MSKTVAFLALILIASAFRMVDKVSDPIPCIQEKCPKEYAECEKDPKCVPALNDCYKKCGSKKSCWEFCLPSKGSQAAIDTAKCAAAKGCTSQVSPIALFSPQDCVEKYCKNEEQACENDRRCIATLSFCDDRCNTSLTCWKECLDRAKEVNATKYITCVIDHNCLNATNTALIPVSDIQDCLKEKCPSQYAECEKDPKCLPTLEECQKKCGTKTTCWELCLGGKGSQAAIDTAKCAHAQGCDKQGLHRGFHTALAVYAPEDCIKQYCSDEARACGMNAACLNALKTCEEQCQDNQTCWTGCLAKQGNTQASAFWKCILDHDCLNKVETETAQVQSIKVHPFLQCMNKSCLSNQLECLYDKHCSKALHKCSKGKKFDYDYECLFSRSKDSELLSSWYQCAGENFCL